MIGSALTQGVGVATGLQSKFDWAGVAAAGVGGGIAARVGATKALGQFGNTGQRFISSMASDIANAATRTLIDGSDFGDNLLAALPDVLGQTIGAAVADGVQALEMKGLAAKLASADGIPEQLRGSAKVKQLMMEALRSGFTRAQIEAAFKQDGFAQSLTYIIANGVDDVSSSRGYAAASDADGKAMTENPLARMAKDWIDRTNRDRASVAEGNKIKRNESTFADYRELRGDDWRNLTPEEKAAVQKAYPDLDISKAAIVNGPGNSWKAWSTFVFGGNPAITLGDTVFVNDRKVDAAGHPVKYFDSNWADNPYQLRTLLHEFTHVYQYQTYGERQVERGIIAQSHMGLDPDSPYDYYRRNNMFGTETWEGQAQMVGDYTFWLATGRAPNTTALPRAELERRMAGTLIYGL